MLKLLGDNDKDILIYYKNDAFDTPENMKVRKVIKEVMENYMRRNSK